MREIRFRAWDKKHNQMRNGVWFRHGVVYLREEQLGVLPLMQYTGLKDKNGLKIYEGDIVKYINTFNQPDKMVIEWDDEYCTWLLPRVVNDTGSHIVRSEIIGNIYENPKLLK